MSKLSNEQLVERRGGEMRRALAWLDTNGFRVFRVSPGFEDRDPIYPGGQAEQVVIDAYGRTAKRHEA